MDPFEEFEFKPLTEGIGFHKKSSLLKETTKQAQLVEDQLKKVIPEPPPDSLLGIPATPAAPRKALGYQDLLKATQPMPKVSLQPEVERPPLRNPPLPQPIIPPLPIKGSLGSKGFIDKKADTGVRRGAADSPVGGLQEVSVCFKAAAVDLVFVIALSLIFLVSLLGVTKVSLSTVVASTQVDVTTQLSMFLLFIAVMQMYVIVSRSFFGRTLGEWTFDHQLGSDEQQASPYYPLQVAGRSLLVTLTGVLLLPLLSFIFRKDLAASLSGLQLYRQKI